MYEILNYKSNKYWRNLLNENNIHSVLFSPEYLRLWELNGDGEAKLFFYRCDYGVVLYPFLIRKINVLKFFQQMKTTEKFYDITSPYGYGGPLTKSYSKSNNNLLVDRFTKEFSLFCKKQYCIRIYSIPSTNGKSCKFY